MIAGATIVQLAGCAASSKDEAADTGASAATLTVEAVFLERTGVPLGEARDALGMSDETYQIYQDAAERGYVLASDVQRVIPDLTACVEPLGFEVAFDPGEPGYFGLSDITWGIVTPDGYEMTNADDAFIQACSDRTVGPLESLFFNQPYSPEREDTWHNDSRRPASRECIESAGYFASEDGTMQDYVEVAKRIAADTGDTTCLDLVIYGPDARD